MLVLVGWNANCLHKDTRHWLAYRQAKERGASAHFGVCVENKSMHWARAERVAVCYRNVILSKNTKKSQWFNSPNCRFRLTDGFLYTSEQGTATARQVTSLSLLHFLHFYHMLLFNTIFNCCAFCLCLVAMCTLDRGESMGDNSFAYQCAIYWKVNRERDAGFEGKFWFFSENWILNPIWVTFTDNCAKKNGWKKEILVLLLRRKFLTKQRIFKSISKINLKKCSQSWGNSKKLIEWSIKKYPEKRAVSFRSLRHNKW